MRVVLAEQADSGWAVARPSTLAPESEADARARLAIDHVLGQSRMPLLNSPSPSTKRPNDSNPLSGVPRLAQQVPGVEGWRASTSQLLPASPPSTQAGPLWPEHSPTTEKPPEKVEAPIATAPAAAAPNGTVSKAPPSDGSLQFRAPRVDSLPAIKFGQAQRAPEPQSIEANGDDPPELGCNACTDDEAAIVAEDDFELTVDDDANSAESDVTSEAFDSSVTVDDAPAEDAVEGEPSELPSELDENSEVAEIIDEQLDEPSAESSDSAHAPRLIEGAPPAIIAPKPEPKPLPPLTRQLMNLRGKVRNVLKGYYRQTLNSRDNDPWEVMHGMLSYELHSRLHQNGPRGNLITSIGWLCYNKPCKGLTLLYVTPEGELRAKQGVGLQGHKGQLLAMLAQCRVAPEYPIRVGSHEFTIDDLIEAEKKTCYPKTELTFKLIALTHYLDLNDTWVNDEGLDWSIPRLIREELAQPIRGAACGGTHRLSGLSLAVKARQRRGEPLDGEYLKASEYVEKYEHYAFRLQNRDGSLSTRWFQGSGDEDDTDRRVKTTGHILEWLVYSLSDEELRDQRTIRAVNYLATLLYENYDHEWEVGPRSHALHALVRYDERVFKPFDGAKDIAGSKTNQPTARRTQSRSNRR